MTAPILRVKYRVTADQARQLDEARVRHALNGGAHRLYLDRDVVREQRARLEVDENADLASAVDLYLAHKQTGAETADRIRERHARYTAMLADTGDAAPTGGAGAYLPLRLEAENYGPFPTLDHEYETGITVVLGDNRDNPGVDSNGAGKSFVVNAPPVALFGHTPDGVSLTDLVTNDGTAGRMVLTHEFMVGADTYRVRRSVGGRGHTLDLERLFVSDDWDVIPDWQPAGAQGVRDTQDAIVRLLGFTRETFLASSLLVQGAPSWASRQVSRTQRCDLLMDGLGLSEYDALMEFAKADRKAYERDALRLADRIDRDAAELERKDVAENDYYWALEGEHRGIAALAEAQEALEAHTKAWQQAQARSAERRAAEAEHQQAEKERQRLREQAEQADSARENIVREQAHLAELADADALAVAEQRYSEARAEYDRQAFERQTLEAKRAEAVQQRAVLYKELAGIQVQRNALIDRADALEAQPEKDDACPVCKRVFDDAESRHRVIESYWSDASALDARMQNLIAPMLEVEARRDSAGEELAALGVAVAPDDAEVRRAREQVQERARLEERIASWGQALGQVESREFEDKIMAADAALALTVTALSYLRPIDQAQIDRIKQQGLEARAAVTDAQAALDTVRADKTRAQAEVERLTALQERHETEKAEHAHAVTEAAIAGECERMYGRDGLPAYIIEKVAVPYLEEEATRILHKLGLRWEIQIRVEAARKSGDGTKPALDVVIVKENGVEQPYALASGGEDTRVARALQVAFARLFKHRRGAHSELFALDEPPFLDAAGLDAFAGLLDDLAREFAVVQLVSHDSGLRDSFPNRIEIVRENGRSRILGATAELVTA